MSGESTGLLNRRGDQPPGFESPPLRQPKEKTVSDEDYQIANAMCEFGGSFVRALAKAAFRADETNLAKLKAAFPDYWEEYKELARQR